MRPHTSLYSETAISLFIAASIDAITPRLCQCHLLLQNNLLVDSDSRRSAVVVVTVTIIYSIIVS